MSERWVELPLGEVLEPIKHLAGSNGPDLVLSVTEIGYESPDLVKGRGNIFRRQAVTA